MIIQETLYKDVPAFALTTATMRAVAVPVQGGKIVSLQSRKSSKEYLLQNPSKQFLRMGISDDFEARECAGFDDMFPTIDPVRVCTNDGVWLDYPDHGEVCRLPFAPHTGRVSLTFRTQSSALGYTYEKTFTEDADGGLRITYRIQNVAPRDLDALWAAHFLLNIEKGGKLLLPFEEGEPTDVVADRSGKIAVGTRVPLCQALLPGEWQTDNPTSRKLYFPRRVPEGFVGYRAPDGEELLLEFDQIQLPYLGLWINLGDLHGDYCVGLEPASVGYDTVKNAEAYGQKDVLVRGGCKEFFIKLSVK